MLAVLSLSMDHELGVDTSGATRRAGPRCCGVCTAFAQVGGRTGRARHREALWVTQSVMPCPQIFSAMHVSGEQLNQLGGIAAVLRFPLPDLEDMEIPPGE